MSAVYSLVLHITGTKESNSKKRKYKSTYSVRKCSSVRDLILFIPHLPLHPIIMVAAVSHAGASGVVAPAVGKTNVKDDNKCVMCEFVMQFLRNMLEQKDTRVRMLEG